MLSQIMAFQDEHLLTLQQTAFLSKIMFSHQHSSFCLVGITDVMYLSLCNSVPENILRLKIDDKGEKRSAPRVPPKTRDKVRGFDGT